MKWTTRLAYRLFDPETWGAIRADWSLRRRRWNNSHRRAQQLLSGPNPVRLHLGCGLRARPGWINIDAFEQPGVDLRWDLRDPFPCPAEVAEAVYSEHVLEHLEREHAEQLLAESCRLLRPGGRIRIGVPDAEIYFRAYANSDDAFFAAVRHLGGAVRPLETPIEVINHMFRMGGAHRYAWDFPTLRNSLLNAGFAAVVRWNSGESSSQDICLDDPAHAFETLYVEAVKPDDPIPNL